MAKVVAVFGATGGQGGGVVTALLGAIGEGKSYTVRAITRNPSSEKAQGLKRRGCEIVKCDLDDNSSVKSAVTGCYGVYLVTNYWDHFSVEKEIEQGKRVTDICKDEGVKHLVYSGLEDVNKAIGIPCGHFDSKGQVEEYIRSQGPPHTIVRFSFYFNNFLSMFAPKKGADGNFEVAIPMEGVAMDGIDVGQGGACVLGILEQPEKYLGKTIGLSGDKLTIEEYAAIFTKRLCPRVFKDPKISLDTYRGLGFPGAVELGNMFEFYKRGNPDRDVHATKQLNPALMSFEEWVKANKASLEAVFK